MEMMIEESRLHEVNSQDFDHVYLVNTSGDTGLRVDLSGRISAYTDAQASQPAALKRVLLVIVYDPMDEDAAIRVRDTLLH